MYESDIQSEVSSAVITGEVDSLTVKVTDNERVVIIDIGNRDAAYTADEARKFAQNLKCVSDQRWGSDNDRLIEYIRDLADLVDGYKSEKEIEEKWSDREVDSSL